MSSSYSSSGKPRGRRETETSETESRSRASSGTSHRLTKTSSRTLENSSTPRNSRPSSPTLFLQRNRTVDPSRPTDSVLISPKSSSAFIKPDVTSNPREPENTSSPSSPTKTRSVTSRRSEDNPRGSSGSIGFGVDNIRQSVTNRRSAEITSAPREPPQQQRTSQSSITSISKMQPTVTDPSEEQETARKSSRSSAGRSSQENVKSPEVKPYQPPNTATPTMSPPQSPSMQYNNNFGPPSGQMQYGYPPNMMQSSQFQPNYYPPPFTSPPPAPAPEVSRSMTPGAEEERQRLLQKVTGVLPDINRLLDNYAETKGQLTAKDLLIKQTEIQRSEENSRLRFELEAKKEEFEKLIEKLVGENYRFKLDLADNNKTIATLHETVKDHQTLKGELERMKPKLADLAATADAARLAKEQLLSDKIKLTNDVEEVKRKRAADYEQHKRGIADLKDQHKDQLQSKDKEHARAAAEHKMVLSKVQLELANLITKHATQKKDLEASRGTVASLEQKLASKAKEHEDSLAAHKTELEAKTKEYEDTIAAHKAELEVKAKEAENALAAHKAELETKAKETEEMMAQHSQQLASQLESLTSKHGEELKALGDTHEKALDDVRAERDAHLAKVEEHETRIKEIEGDLESEKGAHNTLKTQHEEVTTKHAEVTGAMTSWKKRHTEWQEENDKLHKLMETFR